jgi:hypothetical protein
MKWLHEYIQYSNSRETNEDTRYTKLGYSRENSSSVRTNTVGAINSRRIRYAS